MGILDFLKRKSQREDTNVGIVPNESVKIEKFIPNKNAVSYFENQTIPENVRDLLWIADGKYKNYDPADNEERSYENELFRITFCFDTEPSLIHTTLPINYKAKINPQKSIGYYPTYERMTPSQRWTYLNWLRDVSKPIDIGYVFIFYYGLERHLVYGNYKDAVDMILLLRQYHNNNSFNGYSSNALIASAIFHKDKDTLLKILENIEEGSYHGNLLLIAKTLMKMDLSAKEIMSLSSDVGFKNKRYIKKYPDLFSQKVSSILESEFGNNTLPFYNIDAKFKAKQSLVFANTSFSSEIRSPYLPSIIDNSDFKSTLYEILTTAHDSLKTDLEKMRKAGIKPESTESMKIERTAKTEDETVTICPYCKTALDKAPKRKKKCPHCGNYIYVRSNQILPYTLFTQKGAIAVDHFKRLKDYGITEADFITKRSELTEKFGFEANPNDVVWGLYQDFLLETMRGNPVDYHTLKMIYFEEALFLYKEKRPFFQLLQESARMELIRYQQQGIENVEILTAGSASCKSCQKMKGRALTIIQALEEMPVPCSECTYELEKGKPGWCRCGYNPVVDI